MRLPPLGSDPDAFTAVEPLSLWETTAIVAYTTSADWIRGIVTLAAPPAVAQELLNPARALTSSSTPWRRRGRSCSQPVTWLATQGPPALRLPVVR